MIIISWIHNAFHGKRSNPASGYQRCKEFGVSACVPSTAEKWNAGTHGVNSPVATGRLWWA